MTPKLAKFILLEADNFGYEFTLKIFTDERNQVGQTQIIKENEFSKIPQILSKANEQIKKAHSEARQGRLI